MCDVIKKLLATIEGRRKEPRRTMAERKRRTKAEVREDLIKDIKALEESIEKKKAQLSDKKAQLERMDTQLLLEENKQLIEFLAMHKIDNTAAVDALKKAFPETAVSAPNYQSQQNDF